ncbi:tRNA(Ile2) 2-agmatinylcytidine synthetase [Halobacteriales archaeon QS_3_64_16]|nr:MAG: tRNA(Ile2) 2-agmatinylcytidine synthetase [Halobacteriales archaeon QS_3_64_16]
MAVIGLDDTDSRERGMCTTYLAATIATRLRERGHRVSRGLLVRLNPAIEHKTRGNAALAIHTSCSENEAFAIAREAIEKVAETDDPNTNPGLVVASDASVSPPIADFSARATGSRLAIADAREVCASAGYTSHGWEDGQGLIGALAAVGAWRAFSEWTVEHIAYREPERWGTPRSVDTDSLFAAADRGYPTTWDTVDRGEGEAICVPRTPCPVLFGVRGEGQAAARKVADAIDSEPIERTATFLTNQGTDAHLREGSISLVENGRAYRLSGTVASAPETRRGGHVHFELAEGNVDDGDSRGGDAGENGQDDRASRLGCVAFEPTKRFRDRVRALRAGDHLTVCGEVSEGALKLEKFAVRDLLRTENVTPTCPRCERSMESAGREQGYRCRDCGTDREGKVPRPLDRDLEVGWYEVPPRARRHVAKPLVRGGFDAPTHPER